MPPLSGFSDNPFVSRNDAVTATRALIEPLVPYFSQGKARINIPLTSGAHFDGAAAQLEGYGRPLWAVAALLSGQGEHGPSDAISQQLLKNWIEGLENGVNPLHAEYWGPIGDWDQRMVEAEVISFALLAVPEILYTPLSADAKGNLQSWLEGMNGKVMPENNWRWFRVFTNLALIKVCGASEEVHWPIMKQDLKVLDSFVIGDGWSSDGVWKPHDMDETGKHTAENAGRSRQADYYSGSFAIQFSQMLYCKFASDLDPERCQRFREGINDFCRTYWTFFDIDGAAIPFGRSLAYKFAMGAYYAAFAYCGFCDDSNEFTSPGAVKGMLLRHMRWWASNSADIFWPDGTLNIGYLYPNMYMSENYNSPQSPYWALKSLIVVALSNNDGFWATPEAPHPLHPKATGALEARYGVQVIKPARQILCNHPQGQHHFLLSSGQHCAWPMKATQAKYGKFAYSSAFGFSVPTGPLLAQIAPDSTLALSRDQGETWAVRWSSVGQTRYEPLEVAGLQGTVTCMMSRWCPWASSGIEIETTLIPPCDKWPDWHVRVHRIRGTGGAPRDGSSLIAVDAGFAIYGQKQSDSRVIPTVKSQHADAVLLLGSNHDELAEETLNSALVISAAGASGVIDLSPQAGDATRRGDVMRPDPNTNIMVTKTMIPNIRHTMGEWPEGELILASGVFAIAARGAALPTDIAQRWERRPQLSFTKSGSIIIA